MEKCNMPQTAALTAEMVESCKEEFMETDAGRVFKDHYARLNQEIDNLHNQMDAHLYAYMRSKFGM